MKKFILFIIGILFSLSIFAIDTEVKTEAYKHDYETYFVYLDGGQYQIYYKNNYGDIKKIVSLITPNMIKNLSDKEKEECKELANSEYFKHEYDSFFAIPVQDEYCIFYRDDMGQIITILMTSINKPKYIEDKKEFNEYIKDQQPVDYSDKSSSDDKDDGKGWPWWLWLIIIWLIFKFLFD